MIFHVLTLFPGIIHSATSESILGKARERGLVRVNAVDIRDFAEDRHRVVDDYPYGGGPGMVMKAEPVVEAVRSLNLGAHVPVLLLSPGGRPFDQALAEELAASSELAVICGRYEGIDERVRKILPVREISVGDFILSGGEFAALVIIDAVARLVPGVLGDDRSASDESFSSGLLEHPHYTRPAEYRGHRVPEVLLSGDHAGIQRWRREQALLRTLRSRPDLLERAHLTEDDKKFLEKAKKGTIFENNGDK